MVEQRPFKPQVLGSTPSHPIKKQKETNMCCDPKFLNSERHLIDGECPDCGEPTVDGEAFEICSYSPCECNTCDHRPCDDSC